MQMTDDRATQEAFDVDSIEYNVFEMPPPGEYRAVFTKALGVMIDYKKGKGPEKAIELHFTLDARKENGEPHTIHVATSPSFGSKGRLRPLLTALGEDVNKINPRAFKLSSFFGKKLRLYLVEETKTDGSGGKRTVIQAYLPLKAAAPAKPLPPVGSTGAPAPPADDPFQDDDE